MSIEELVMQQPKTASGLGIDDAAHRSTWRWFALAIALLVMACTPAAVGRYDRAVKDPMFGPSSRSTPVIENQSWQALNRRGETLTFEFKDGSANWVTSITHDKKSYPLWQSFRRSADARYLFVPYIHIEPDDTAYYALIELDTVERTEESTSVSGKVAKKYLWRR